MTGTCCGSDIGSSKLVSEVGVWLAVKSRNSIIRSKCESGILKEHRSKGHPLCLGYDACAGEYVLRVICI